VLSGIILSFLPFCFEAKDLVVARSVRQSKNRGEASGVIIEVVSVSVLIPTKNGEQYLDELLTAVKSQKGNASVGEIIAVDSGSRDRSVEILRHHGARVMQIPPQEFGHGKTRNLAASQTKSEYLVFLTQDATPANEHWLENLLAPLQADPLIVGAYSRHLPRPSCHPMEWRRIVEQELTGRKESQVNSARDNPDYARNPALYYFFANTCSIIRRQVWQHFPFPAVEFAEDHFWAKQVLEAGYKTAYCANSQVYHSHGYGPWINFCRHFEHAWAVHQLSRPHEVLLKHCFPAALRAARADLAFWYHHQGQSKTQILLRWALPAVSWHLAANLGSWLGERADVLLPRKVALLLSLQERIKRR